MDVKYFVVSFPFSNAAMYRYFPGETAECVTHGLHALYDTLVHHGRQRHPEPEPSGRRGRVKRDLAQNLLTRLETHRSEIMAFVADIIIPFDNNAAERALRMMKVKQRVSGSFRSEQGGHIFAAIRSDVVTARQHGQSPLAVLRAALAGHPWQPS
jgi:transposase